MKAALHFTLPEEEDKFWLAQNGWKYRRLLDDLDLLLRDAHKYDGEEFRPESLTQEQWADATDKVRSIIWQLKDDANLPSD